MKSSLSIEGVSGSGGFIPASLCFGHLEVKDGKDTISVDEPRGSVVPKQA